MTSWWRRLFGSGPARPRAPGDDIAVTIVQDGRRRDVTVRELAVGTKLAGDALLQVLVERGLVTHEEIAEKIRKISQEHFRPGEPPADGPGAPARPR